ncbi:MAG: hypothetical protein ABIO68_03580 [Sphingomicrobium sp.]
MLEPPEFSSRLVNSGTQVGYDFLVDRIAKRIKLRFGLRQRLGQLAGRLGTSRRPSRLGGFTHARTLQAIG